MMKSDESRDRSLKMLLSEYLPGIKTLAHTHPLRQSAYRCLLLLLLLAFRME